MKLKSQRTDNRRVMNNSDVFELLRGGTYVVNHDTGEVTGPRGVVTPFEFSRRGSKHADLFVRLYVVIDGRKLVKSIAVQRLVWMSAAGMPIPEGFEIHHPEALEETARLLEEYGPRYRRWCIAYSDEWNQDGSIQRPLFV